MGEIRLSVGQVNISNWLKVNVREVGNPTAIVATHNEPPPVPATMNLLFSGLNDVVHYVDFRESPDGSAQGTLLSTFVYDVKNETIIAERRYYTTDGVGAYDPVQDDTSITDPYLVGKTVYGVFKEGFRYLVPGTEWTQTGDTIDILAGGPLQSLEVVTIEINYTVGASASGGASTPTDIIEVTANLTLDSSHYDKMMEANGSATILTITFPDLLTIPDGKKFWFNAHKDAQRYIAIVFPSGGYCQVDGSARTTVWVAKGEELSIIKKGSYMRIISWSGDRNRVGQIVYGGTKEPINGIPLLGGWVPIADVPRLFNWYVNELDFTELGSGTDDIEPSADNRTKWIIGATKLWFPDHGGLFHRAKDHDGNNDDVRLPNAYQADAVGPATVKTRVFTGNGLLKNGLPGGTPGVGILGTLGDGGSITTDSASGLNNNNAHTDPWDLISTAGQTRPKNVAVIAYVII